MMSAYIEKLQNADTSSEEKYNAVVDECNQELLEFISRMREVEPLLVPITFVNEDYPNNIQVDKFIKRVTDRANNRRKLDYVFAGCCVTREIQKRIWRFPTFINIKETPNFGIYPKENNCHPRIISETLNQIILSGLISLPVGLVKVHLIDPQWSNQASYLTQIVPSALWKIYHEDEEIYSLWDSLTDYMKSVTSNPTSKDRYITHLVVILEYDHNSYERSTRFLRECGFQCGIHFIYVSTKNLYMEHNDVIIDEHYFFKNDKDENNLLLKPCKLINNPKLVLACSNYLNSIPTEALNLLQQFENNYEEFHKCHKEKAIRRKAEETERRKAEEEARKNAEEIVKKEIDEINRKALEEARKKADEDTRIVIKLHDDNVSGNFNNIELKDNQGMSELAGYEEVQTITAYYNPFSNRKEKIRYNKKRFKLYAKHLFGNVVLFRVLGNHVYKVELIEETTLYDYDDKAYFENFPPTPITVNATFRTRMDTYFFWLPK